MLPPNNPNNKEASKGTSKDTKGRNLEYNQDELIRNLDKIHNRRLKEENDLRKNSNLPMDEEKVQKDLEALQSTMLTRSTKNNRPRTGTSQNMSKSQNNENIPPIQNKVPSRKIDTIIDDDNFDSSTYDPDAERERLRLDLIKNMSNDFDDDDDFNDDNFDNNNNTSNNTNITSNTNNSSNYSDINENEVNLLTNLEKLKEKRKLEERAEFEKQRELKRLQDKEEERKIQEIQARRKKEQDEIDEREREIQEEIDRRFEIDLDTIDLYTDEVERQIRWKKAIPSVILEIREHILEQREMYMKEGDPSEVATETTLDQMGDPTLLGLDFDAVYRPKPQIFNFFIVTFLFLIGSFLQIYIFSHEPYNLTSNYFPIYASSYLVFICSYYLDFTILGRYSKIIYILLFLISILLCGLSYNHYYLSPLFFHAYASLVFPLIFALCVYDNKNYGLHGILICGIFASLLASMLIIHLFTSSVIIFIFTALLILSYALIKNWFYVDFKTALKSILFPLIAIILIINIVLRYDTYMYNNLTIFLDPESDPYGAGYLYIMLRGIIDASKFFGKGIHIENLTISNVPLEYSLNFFIYEFGKIILFIIVVPLILFLVYSLIQIKKQKSFLGSILILSVILPIGIQSTIYILTNLGIIMTTGYLPFISYGYINQVISASLMGFVLSIFRIGYLYKDEIVYDDDDVNTD